MSKVDQFESQFRAAAKPAYAWSPPRLDRILVVTDRDPEAAVRFADGVSRYLGDVAPRADWRTLQVGDFEDVDELLRRVAEREPDLICTYRHLHSGAWRYPHSLGEYVDVLTQVATCPVLLVGHPDRDGASPLPSTRDDVMAITDHLAGDDDLVSWAAALVRSGSRLHLTHVEDGATFERYMSSIAKIPAIDTADARELIERQLLKEPADYIESCREVLAAHALELTIDAVVTIGRRLPEYQRLIADHGVDLLVMHTRDEDQLAMHGLAYPLAVELRDIPLLLI